MIASWSIMSEAVNTEAFLHEWDCACEEAQREGSFAWIYWNDKLIGRTRHAAFMQPKVPKHDPERDK
ncbi:MAG: hypothetical protein EBS90_13515 [Betaproteobacteria bacterium]|nr:hypothetical protein [Betaproteobacteria bacterium]